VVLTNSFHCYVCHSVLGTILRMTPSEKFDLWWCDDDEIASGSVFLKTMHDYVGVNFNVFAGFLCSSPSSGIMMIILVFLFVA